jgi:surface polysaccharide O-acyltransferase-like enzyme
MYNLTAKQQAILDPLLSKRIHSLRFLLIVFVVFIHGDGGITDTGVNFADGIQTFKVPFYVAKIHELTDAITCVAVPLFFLISSFLLYIKEPVFSENLKKKCKTILLPYFSWAILVILFLFIAQSFNFTKPYFATSIVRDFSPLDWIGAFLGHFGRFTLLPPLAYQFWFLRDLFVLNLLFVIIKRIVDLCPGGVFVLFFLLWIGDINIYIVNTSALFFFTLGYYIVKYKVSYKHIDNIKTSDIVLMYMITILAGLFFREEVTIISCINIIVGIMFFIKLSYSFVKTEKTYKILSWLEQYAFWVYATHVIAIAAMIKISIKIMPMNGGWLLINYFGVTLLCISILVGIGIIFKRIFPKTFSILTGGR